MDLRECQAETREPIRAMINNVFFVQGTPSGKQQQHVYDHTHFFQKKILWNSMKITFLLLKLPLLQDLSVRKLSQRLAN